MITKLCIICLSMTASTMFGLINMRNKKRRIDYLDSLIKLCDYLISEISFNKDKLITALEKFADTDNTELANQLKTFCESPYSDKIIYPKFLKKDEQVTVSDFFSSLGCTDGETQISQLQNYKKRFGDIDCYEEDKFKKSGSVGLKLSVLFGIAVGILIL